MLKTTIKKYIALVVLLASPLGITTMNAFTVVNNTKTPRTVSLNATTIKVPANGKKTIKIKPCSSMNVAITTDKKKSKWIFFEKTKTSMVSYSFNSYHVVIDGGNNIHYYGANDSQKIDDSWGLAILDINDSFLGITSSKLFDWQDFKTYCLHPSLLAKLSK